jgi:molybdopterin-binding protein
LFSVAPFLLWRFLHSLRPLRSLLARREPAVRRRARRLTPDEAVGGLGARNRLHGFVEEGRVDGLPAQLRLRVGDQTLTAVITADAVRALKLRRGPPSPSSSRPR